MTKSFHFFCILIISGTTALAQSNTLQYFVNQARANSPLLKDYRNQVRTNFADSERIRATYKPQVSGSSVNIYAPIIGGYGYDQAISNGGGFATLIGVNKTIVSSKNLNTQFETLRLQNESLENTAGISEQELTRTITMQYITAYGIMEDMRFNQVIIDLLKKEEAILKTLTERNVYRQTDYLTFLVTYQQEELTVQQLRIQFQNECGTLNYLAGISDTNTVALEDPQISVSRLPDISTSVFFRHFEIDSLKSINSKALIDFSYKPKINLFADAGFNSTFAYTPYKNFGTGFGFSVSVPIYDGHQRQLQYRKIDIAEETRINYRNFYTNQYYQQIAQLTRQLSSTEELIARINEQIRYSESLINVNEKLLATGDVHIADYIVALQNYLQAKNLLTQNNITRLQIIAQINYWNK